MGAAMLSISGTGFTASSGSIEGSGTLHSLSEIEGK